MRLLPNMHLIMKAKIDYTPKPQCLFGSTCTWSSCRDRRRRVVDIVPLQFASDEAAGCKVDIVELPLHWV